MCPFSEISVIIERDIEHRWASFYHVITPISDHVQMTSYVYPCSLMTRFEKRNEQRKRVKLHQSSCTFLAFFCLQLLS